MDQSKSSPIISPSQLWRPGLQNTPWLAIAAILIAVACLIASTIIIVVSDNQPVSSWSIRLAVLLAIISSISHLALGFAISNARTIIWWRNALHRTTIGQLYYLWNPTRHWRSLESAIPGIDYKKIFFTTIIVSIANLATAPLLQRAIYIQNGFITKDTTLEIGMVERIPAAHIGYVDYRHIESDIPGSIRGTSSNVSVAPPWSNIIQQWKANTTILIPAHPKNYCNGRCEGNIRATGVITNCSSTTRSVSLNNGTNVFSIDFIQREDYAHMPILTFTTTYSVAVDNSTCVATIVDETCDVKVASVQYSIIIENRTITLNSDKYPNTGELEPYAGDLPNSPQGHLAGPLAGLTDSFGTYWWSYTKVTKGLDPKTNTTSFIASMYGVADRYYNHRKANAISNGYCFITFKRPTDDIVKFLPQVLFRAGLFLATPNDTHNIPMVQTTPALIYHSEYSWFVIAVTIMATATFSCIIPLWGWWELGRKVTLNPVETAKAFNVPQMVGSGCSAKDIFEDIGGLQVGYTQVQLQDAIGNSLPSMELRSLEG
jgi:hypothetical protein